MKNGKSPFFTQTSLCSHCLEHACYPGLNSFYNLDGQLNFKATRFPVRFEYCVSARPGNETEIVSQKNICLQERTEFCFKTPDILTVVIPLGLASDYIAFC